MKSAAWRFQEVLNELKSIPANEEPYIEPFSHGTMQLGLYAPRENDPQTPHSQDELYFVASGSGVFFNNGERVAFNEGDALFVAAGVEHSFEDYSNDFVAWVVFWGPQGGEEN